MEWSRLLVKPGDFPRRMSQSSGYLKQLESEVVINTVNLIWNMIWKRNGKKRGKKWTGTSDSPRSVICLHGVCLQRVSCGSQQVKALMGRAGPLRQANDKISIFVCACECTATVKSWFTCISVPWTYSQWSSQQERISYIEWMTSDERAEWHKILVSCSWLLLALSQCLLWSEWIKSPLEEYVTSQ